MGAGVADARRSVRPSAERDRDRATWAMLVVTTGFDRGPGHAKHEPREGRHSVDALPPEGRNLLRGNYFLPGVTVSIAALRSSTAHRPRWLRQAPAEAGARTTSSSPPP